METVKEVRLQRWRKPEYPSSALLINNLRSEGVRPYVWENGPNFRYASHSHGYDTILYCVEGSLQVIFEEVDQIIDLGTGDRLDIPAGIRHAIVIGPSGARCLEADHR